MIASGNCWRGTSWRDRVDRRQVRHALVDVDAHCRSVQVAGEAALGIAREVERRGRRGVPGMQAAHVDARLPQPLHGHHQTMPRAHCAAGGAAARAAEAGARPPAAR